MPTTSRGRDTCEWLLSAVTCSGTEARTLAQIRYKRYFAAGAAVGSGPVLAAWLAPSSCCQLDSSCQLGPPHAAAAASSSTHHCKLHDSESHSLYRRPHLAARPHNPQLHSRLQPAFRRPEELTLQEEAIGCKRTHPPAVLH